MGSVWENIKTTRMLYNVAFKKQTRIKKVATSGKKGCTQKSLYFADAEVAGIRKMIIICVVKRGINVISNTVILWSIRSTPLNLQNKQMLENVGTEDIIKCWHRVYID